MSPSVHPHKVYEQLQFSNKTFMTTLPICKDNLVSTVLAKDGHVLDKGAHSWADYLSLELLARP